MKVTVTRRSVATGSWSGKQGQTVEVPDQVGKLWLALGYAKEAAEPTPEPKEPKSKRQSAKS